MTPPAGTARNGRIAGALLLLFALAYGVAGARIDYAFSSDPLGPRVFPVALAVALAGFAALYLMKPGASEAWPRGRDLAAAAAVPALVAAGALLLEPLGFPLAILVMTAGVGRVFGASWAKALVAGAIHAALWYVVFVVLLDVQLPGIPFLRR